MSDEDIKKTVELEEEEEEEEEEICQVCGSKGHTSHPIAVVAVNATLLVVGVCAIKMSADFTYTRLLRLLSVL